MQINFREELSILLRHFDLLKYPCAEIGVASGEFSRDILNWNVAHLYMVDKWAHTPNVAGDTNFPQEWHTANYTNAFNLVSKFAPRFTFLKGDSVEMASRVDDNSLGMAYFDAGHGYESVLADLKAWYPKVIKGGILAGHDYLAKEYGVKQAVEEFTRGKYSVHTIPDIDEAHSGFWFQKV